MLSTENFHQYQHNSVTLLYEHEGILGIVPTGGGKTAVGLTAFAELQRDGFVRQGILLAPKRVAMSVWPNEPADWEQLQHLNVKPAFGTPKQRAAALNDPDIDMVCVGTNSVEWFLQECCTWAKDDPRFDILIVDESSKFKDPRGAWAKALVKLSKMFKTVWLLTGSPRPNSELDYWVPMKVVSRERLWGRSYDKWRRENFYPTDFAQRVWQIHRHYVDTLNADVAKYTFKVPMSAVPRPASDPIIHKVQLTPAARVQYKKMERELFSTIDGQDIVAFDAAVSSGKLSQLAQGFMYDDEKVAHAVHHAKTAMVEELIANTEGDAAALVYWFKEDLVRLRDLIPGLVWLGDEVSDKRALEIEDEWNAGNIEHLALHPASAGHGLNLQKVTAQLIHYSLTWSAELYDQTVARIARQGYVGDKLNWLVLNHHIVAEDTIDEAKMLRVSGKLTAQEAAMQYIRSA